MNAEELHVIIQNSMAQAGCGYVGFEELSQDQLNAMMIAAERVNAVIRRERDAAVTSHSAWMQNRRTRIAGDY